ncbi:MAG: efflux RND transporter permease subunit [Acidobacteria bacterium]|nr:efflux RND transporter permease subunit [Candidatus Sulfomarinibacter sp. MAG AM1]
MRLTDLPLDRPVATLMLLLSLVVLGTVSLFLLPLDFMPVVNEPEVDIEVPFPGSHPLESLREVVEPIEDEIATIPDVKSINGNASSGSARLEVRFDWNVDIDIKKMEIREAV